MVALRRIAAVAILCCIATDAHAQGVILSIPDQIIAGFVNQANGWAATFTGYARTTFYSLALITLAWKLIQLALVQAVMEQVVEELVNSAVLFGMGTFFLDQGPAILKAIIDSFRTAGGVAGQIAITPTEILVAGVDIALKVWAQISVWNPAASAGLIIVAIVLLGCIGVIAAQMTVVLVKSAFYIPFCMFFAGFLGSYWTKPMAMSVLMQAFGLGAKLMTLELFAGSSLAFIRIMINSMNDFTSPTVGAVIMMSLLLAILVSHVPGWFAGIAGGAPFGEAAIVSRAAAAAAIGTVGAAVGLTGGGMAFNSALKLASAQQAASEAGGAAPKTGIARAAAIAGGAARNLGTAAANDVGQRLAGQRTRHGSMPWRASADMQQQRRLLADDMAKPKP